MAMVEIMEGIRVEESIAERYFEEKRLQEEERDWEERAFQDLKELAKNDDFDIFSDIYKDLNGFRPSRETFEMFKTFE